MSTLGEWKTCRCGAVLPVFSDNLFPEHFEGDAPAWWNVPRCALSGKLTQRRKPRMSEWWEKYGVQRKR